MRKSYKPDEKPAGNNGPMEDRTTHRVDFIPHPLEKPFVHHGDEYKAPEGDMDMMTNYHKEYTKKPLEIVKPIKRDDQRKVPGKFEGEPTYQADYRKWGLQPREKITADVPYRPPSAPFEGNTNYQHDFIPHRSAPRQSMKPNDTAKVSDQPFEDQTDYRQSYIKHPLAPREVKEKPVWEPNNAPLDDLSHYRKDYTPKDVGKTQSCKPNAAPYQSEAPFEGNTTQKVDYILWPTEKPFVREHDLYRKPEGEMYMNTTTQTDYTKKPMERQMAVRPLESKKVPGKFDDTTNYKTEYRKWDLGDRPAQTMRDQYVPNEAPFDGMPTYQRDYIPHPTEKTRSLKPVDLGYSSNAPLEDGTEYKKEYTRKYVPPCPVPIIESGVDIGYTYRDQDDVGHKWYDFAAGTERARRINSPGFMKQLGK